MEESTSPDVYVVGVDFGTLSGRAVVKVTLPDIVKEQYSSIQDEFTQEKVQKRFDNAKGLSLRSFNLDSSGRHPRCTSSRRPARRPARRPPRSALDG